MRIKLQYAVAKVYYYSGFPILEDYKHLKWFNTEDEAVFDFVDNFREEIPDNMVIKRVVKI